MLRLLGLRTISKWESHHLILGTLIVSCSNQSCKINLNHTYTQRSNFMFNLTYNVDTVLESNKTPEEKEKFMRGKEIIKQENEYLRYICPLHG